MIVISILIQIIVIITLAISSPIKSLSCCFCRAEQRNRNVMSLKMLNWNNEKWPGATSANFKRPNRMICYYPQMININIVGDMKDTQATHGIWGSYMKNRRLISHLVWLRLYPRRSQAPLILIYCALQRSIIRKQTETQHILTDLMLEGVRC